MYVRAAAHYRDVKQRDLFDSLETAHRCAATLDKALGQDGVVLALGYADPEEAVRQPYFVQTLREELKKLSRASEAAF